MIAMFIHGPKNVFWPKFRQVCVQHWVLEVRPSVDLTLFGASRHKRKAIREILLLETKLPVLECYTCNDVEAEISIRNEKLGCSLSTYFKLFRVALFFATNIMFIEEVNRISVVDTPWTGNLHGTTQGITNTKKETISEA